MNEHPATPNPGPWTLKIENLRFEDCQQRAIFESNDHGKALCVQETGETFHFSTGDGVFWSVIVVVCVWVLNRLWRD